MPLDVYSPCPGGTGKKIKFCCSDLVSDLQKIERMLEGEQYQACLSHIERLEEKHPGRACLMGIKCLLLRSGGRLDDARDVAARFLQRYPGNPIALAETAILTAGKDGGRPAMPWVQRALAACTDEIPERISDMLSTVGQVLVLEGHYLAARCVLQWAAMIDREDPVAPDLLGRINGSREIPVWVKDTRGLVDCPPDVPWRAEFEQSVAQVRGGQWSAAEEQLLALASKVGDQPAIWRNVAILRSWLADHVGCAAAMHKVAALDVPWEDAAEAEAVALFMSEDPLGDQVDVLSLTYPVGDAERFQAAAGSAARMRQLQGDLAPFAAEGEPPPLAAYSLIDRPLLSPGADVTLDSVPRLLCHALFYGRQTDRDARLELHPVAARDLEAVQGVLAESAPEALGPMAKQEVTEHISRTQELLARNWSLPRETPPEQIARLARQHFEATLLGRWPALPLGILDGKSPQEAAGEPRWHARLLAAILLLEFWLHANGSRFDFNALRSKLGLPTLEPIDPEQADVAAFPVARLSRIIVEKLSDVALVQCFHRALGVSAVDVMRKFGRALVDRPNAVERDERIQVCSLLARIEDDAERAIHCVDEGRKAAEAAGQSSASWDLLELSIRFARGDEAEAQRLWHHLSTEHIREPGVASALRQWLVQIGAIRPDGTPVAPPPQPETPLVVPGQGDAEPGKLWVPGGEQTGGEKPKLWTP